eukprot:jgi/Chlat1/2717/Chrsp180S02880
MVRAKLRKGKKAFRRDTPEAAAAQAAVIAQEARDARSGGPVSHLPDQELFFEDTTKSTVVRKTKAQIQKEKGPLHCESVLQRSSLVKPVTWPTRRIKQSVKGNKPTLEQHAVVVSKQVDTSEEEKAVELWTDEAEGVARRKASSATASTARPVPAVEVCPPGSSYHPPEDAHQDVLAQAVAREMTKVYQRELQPASVPVITNEQAMLMSGEDVYFLNVDDGNDANDASEPDDNEAPAVLRRREKHTRADLNKKKRAREQARLEAEVSRRKKLRKELDRLPEIESELGEEERARALRKLRLETSREDKRKELPRRLGKHKFEPEAPPVLLTEEVSGSLRQLKSVVSLTKDRFKSLQRRELIEPRVRVHRKQPKRRKTYIPGHKGDKEREMHAQTLAERAMSKTGPMLELVT